MIPTSRGQQPPLLFISRLGRWESCHHPSPAPLLLLFFLIVVAACRRAPLGALWLVSGARSRALDGHGRAVALTGAVGIRALSVSVGWSCLLAAGPADLSLSFI